MQNTGVILSFRLIFSDELDSSYHVDMAMPWK